MDRTLVDFVKALRTAHVEVSPAETLDAMQTMDLVGYQDRAFLKNSLSIVLSKTPDEKEAFDDCFDRFFTFDKFRKGEDAGEEEARDDFDDEGDFDADSDANGNPQSGGKGQGQGGGQASGGESETEETSGLQPNSELGKLLVSGDRTQLMIKMVEAGREVEVSQIVVFTQKGLYTRRIMDAMGLAELNGEIGGLRESPQIPARRLGQELKRRRDWLREQVRDYVERQFMLNADVSGKKLREELLRKVKLSNVEHRNFRLIQEIVYKMAKKLTTMHSRRKKVFKRGQLNVPRTLRHNMSYDGNIFDLHWKSVKIDRPKVFAICDVSGSVAAYARFMLMFLYSLDEVMPKVRSFAFSSDLAEVTELFNRNPIEDAIAKVLRDYSGGSTDYGQALLDFKNHCLDDVDNRTTIIILGDARNNYGDPHAEILKEMYDRSKRIIWLNPESRVSWNTGDSEMRRYHAYSHQVEECNSLMHLERVVGNLLRQVTQ